MQAARRTRAAAGQGDIWIQTLDTRRTARDPEGSRRSGVASPSSSTLHFFVSWPADGAFQGVFKSKTPVTYFLCFPST